MGCPLLCIALLGCACTPVDGLRPAPPAAARRQLWALKEAFVKANGEGLGFKLGLLDFDIAGTTGA